MFLKYNFINIISLVAAGIINSVYFYVLGIPFTRYIAAASIVYFAFFVLILILSGNLGKTKYSFLNNKVFHIGEILILALIVISSLVLKGLDYWNAAGIFVLGLIIVYDSSSTRENVTRFIFLIISPVFYSGLLLQHGYFTEVIFFCAFILMVEKLLRYSNSSMNYFITSASLGFILLFNPFLVLPYIIFFIYYFQWNLKKGIPFLFTSAATYLIIRLLTGIQLSPAGISVDLPYLIPAGIAAIAAGYYSRNIKEVVFAGLLLILISALIKFSSSEYAAGILLLSAVYPMTIIALGDFKTEPWLGKILVD